MLRAEVLTAQLRSGGAACVGYASGYSVKYTVCFLISIICHNPSPVFCQCPCQSAPRWHRGSYRTVRRLLRAHDKL